MQVCKGKSQEKVAFSFTIKALKLNLSVLFSGHLFYYNQLNKYKRS